MYIIHPDNKNDEWYEEKHRNREAYKKGRYQIERDGENSTGNRESEKYLTK